MKTPLTAIIIIDSRSGMINLLHAKTVKNEKILAQTKYINTLKDTSCFSSVFEKTENSEKDIAPIKTMESTGAPEKSNEEMSPFVNTTIAAKKPSITERTL